MSKDNKIIPELRFPEFKNDGEWDILNLLNVSDIIMGSSPSSTSYNENKIGLPLLQGNADIKNRLSVPRIYTTEITKECKVGDILLSVRAPVGTVAKSLHNACIGRGLSAIRAKKPNSQEYLYQWLFSYESSWEKISQGGTFDAINSNDVNGLLVPIPKPSEQQKIALCLSSLDEVIEVHSQKLDLLKEHKKGLMQNLFPQEGEKVPKLRFKEFEKDGEWITKRLDELCKLVRGPFGSALKKEIFVKEGYAVYEQSHAIYSDFSSFRYYIKEDKFSELKRFCVKSGDLIMSCSGTMGKFAIIPQDYKEGVINQALLKLTVKKVMTICLSKPHWKLKISKTIYYYNRLVVPLKMLYQFQELKS